MKESDISKNHQIGLNMNCQETVHDARLFDMISTMKGRSSPLDERTVQKLCN